MGIKIEEKLELPANLERLMSDQGDCRNQNEKLIL